MRFSTKDYQGFLLLRHDFIRVREIDSMSEVVSCVIIINGIKPSIGCVVENTRERDPLVSLEAEAMHEALDALEANYPSVSKQVEEAVLDLFENYQHRLAE